MSPNLNMIIDVVDDQNHPIGRVRRRKVLEEGKNFRTVHILLFQSDQIVLQRLPVEHARSPRLLGSSVAGYMRSGETPFDAARRRLRDELYLSTPLDFRCEFEMKDMRSTKFVTVYTGSVGSLPEYNQREIDSLVLMKESEVSQLARKHPTTFTPTFLEVFPITSERPKRKVAARKSEELLLKVYQASLEGCRFNVELAWDRTKFFLLLNSALITGGIGLFKLADESMLVSMFLVAFFIITIIMSEMGLETVSSGKNYYREAIFKKTLIERELGLLDRTHPVKTAGVRSSGHALRCWGQAFDGETR
ncbi:NUDIX domain-containing protein [Mesorhizobium sp. B1-1-8]|uniref:NUDIX domain-containing protein n=1 Tax=Mesorhizobium sp. B1-1-8 TaxID=2589976 RepID=UPI00112E95CF|nr:NUDIX domain-containing protein [Mesorhizobium sp. B1-1-8]UCI07351.1 NUDIX domain-containing protein [Mesorhizobium sp. B1-1-8]